MERSMTYNAKTEPPINRRISMFHIVPNHQYIRELVRFGVLPASFDPASQPLDVFRADQDYWQSLWLQPGGHDGH